MSGFILDNAKHTEIPASYCFSTFVLDVAERRLWSDDEAVQLVPKQFDLLLFFVANAGRVIKKAEILDAVWPDTFVEETTLARNVSWLRKLIENDGGKRLIATVPKVGYRFTPDVTSSDESGLLVVEEQTVQYTRSEETITIDSGPQQKIVHVPIAISESRRPYVIPAIVILVLAVGIAAGIGITNNLNKKSGSTIATDGSGENEQQSTLGSHTTDRTVIKIGSVVNLQNRYPNDGSYLDAWGMVFSKAEFRQVPTEKMFVSTHDDPNRDNGSGSWEITSADGKGRGEPLTVGDRIFLKNMYPNAGYLDTCGWVEHLRVFDDYSDQTAAVFTTKSSNRDNGSGTWTVRSATEAKGNPVLEEDSIALESNLNIDDTGKVHIAGFLNVTGNVKDIPAFSDYGGKSLVFTKSISPNQSIPDIWAITISRGYPK